MTVPHPRHHVVGIDASLSATGIAVVDIANGASVQYCDTFRTGSLTGQERFDAILREIEVFTNRAALVVLEDVFVGKFPNLELISLNYMIRQQLWQGKIPVAIVNNKKRAKFATGNGNAGKDQVLSAVIRRFQMVVVTDNNSADALVLAAMGCEHLNRRICAMPQANLDAMKGIEWPQVQMRGLAA